MDIKDEGELRGAVKKRRQKMKAEEGINEAIKKRKRGERRSGSSKEGQSMRKVQEEVEEN